MPLSKPQKQVLDCDKRFSRRGDLNRHAKMHLRKKILKCDICDKTFMYKKNIESHKCVCNK